MQRPPGLNLIPTKIFPGKQLKKRADVAGPPIYILPGFKGLKLSMPSFVFPRLINIVVLAFARSGISKELESVCRTQ